jgi:hypothetical protein
MLLNRLASSCVMPHDLARCLASFVLKLFSGSDERATTPSQRFGRSGAGRAVHYHDIVKLNGESSKT